MTWEGFASRRRYTGPCEPCGKRQYTRMKGLQPTSESRTVLDTELHRKGLIVSLQPV